MQDILKILLFSAIAVAYLFLVSKLLGKKQIAQMDVIDYMLGIAVSSIAAEMAIDASDAPLSHYLVSISFFFLTNLLIIFLERKGRFIKNFIKGRPLMVIYEGKIDYKALKKSKMDINDLLAKSRQKGFFDLSEIAYAVFENSGELSILPKDANKQATKKDVAAKLKASKLPCYLVNDGHISYSSLRTINKDKKWLLKKLNLKTDKELKKIILAIYNEDADNIVISFKNS